MMILQFLKPAHRGDGKTPSACPGGAARRPRRPAASRNGSAAGTALAGLALCGLALATPLMADAPPPAPITLTIAWQRDVPRAEITLRAAEPPADQTELTIPLELYGVGGRRHWTGNMTVTFDAGGIGRGATELRLPDQPDRPYRVTMTVNRPEWGIQAREQVFFAEPRDPVQQHGLLFTGRHPEAGVALRMRLHAPDEFLEIEATMRDREQNQVLRKTQRHRLDRQPLDLHVDLTPPPRAIGPFVVEYQVVNETGSINVRHEQRFAHANALVPLTSMQSDRLPDWFKSTYASPRGFNRYSLTFNDTDTIEPADFDSETFRSGGRALRLTYRVGAQTHLYSDLELPGFPLRAHLWVKGNGSGDRLVASFRDRCETARWQHERFVNRSEAIVCTLDFEGWRRFDVPVIGQGLQTDSRHENQQAVATPVYMLAFSVHSDKPKDDAADAAAERTVWIDDLAIETQANPHEQLSIELRTDTPEGRLHDKGTVFVALGNGTGAPISEGRLQLVARDRNGRDVFERSQTLDIPVGDFAFIEIPMAPLAALDPDGPVTLETTFVAPAAAARKRAALVLKAARHAAVFWDFEQAESFSGLRGAPGAATVAGGAEGSAHALSIAVTTNAGNAVILHPALPGVVDRIEMMVKGGPVPVRLRPVFLDAGRTGVSGMNFNRLQTPDMLVDWRDWRRVVVPAPAIPPGYDIDDALFVFQAAYPLNLVLSAHPVDGRAGEVLVDRITVHTHLDDDEAVTLDAVLPPETGILAPDTPLSVRLLNFNAGARQQKMAVRLVDALDQVVLETDRTIDLPPGQATEHVLINTLGQGIYSLAVEGVGAAPKNMTVTAMDLSRHFGRTPNTVLTDLPALEQRLGMTVRRIYLDWDNLEMMPGLFHYDWFHNEIAKASADGTYRVVPILGFAADWAGPEKWEAVLEASYSRFIGSHLQVPVRLTDWSRYVREAVREYAGKVAAWEFWENPDHRGSPAYIPPARYAEMLATVKKWVDLYDPETPVIAAGFSVDNVYPYLQAIENPHDLAFDRLGIQFSIGELSPEAADMEGLLDDLNDLLKLGATGRDLDVPQLDWAIGDLVSPVLQGAYHARASLIMQRTVKQPYRVNLVNDGHSFMGYGLFHRLSYGNTPNVQSVRRLYLPKPSFFAMATTHNMIAAHRFDGTLRIPDRDSSANYAYLYEKNGGGWTAALWRTRGEPREYRRPAAWARVAMTDAFGTAMPLAETLLLGPVPLFFTFPARFDGAQIRHDLRVLEPGDGRDRRDLALMTAEPDSARRANYIASDGAIPVVRRDRRLIGGEPAEYTFLSGLVEERFEFTAGQPGISRLTRTWFCDDGLAGSRLTVILNDGPEQTWDLSFSEAGQRLNQAGIRESSLLLPAVVDGRNRLVIRHSEPGNSAQWTVTPLAEDTVDLAYWGPMNAVQSQGLPLVSASAVGTPLTIGDQTFETGIGTMAPAYLEFPLQQQFKRFEVTVGIDAAAAGRGSVVFTIFADGRQQTGSGTLTGFSPPQTLVIEDLESVSRLVLRVENTETDAGGLANWADAKLVPVGAEIPE